MKLNASNTAIIKRLLAGRNNRPLRSLLSRIEPADTASLFGSLNNRESRLLVDALMTIGRAHQVLEELPEPQLIEILNILEPQEVFHLVNHSSAESAAFLLSHLKEEKQSSLLEKLDSKRREKVLQVLSYPEDSAGRMMYTRVFSLPSHLNASQGLEQLRNRAREESIYYIYCVGQDQILEGIISLRQLATAPADQLLKDILKKDVITVLPETSSEEVARTVAHYDFVALPVVDEHHRLLGVVTVDDVVDIIQEQATANIYAQAGLQEDDRIFTPPRISIRNRVPWMLLNLFLAALASSVVALFESTMSQLIILASLKNIVAGTGGNTAIQTLTVVTRGMATGDFSFISHSRAILKETLVGVSLGVLTGLGAAILTYIWKGNALVSVVIFISMILNALVASSFGAMVPIALKRLNLDPATGSGVIVTTITDIFGFFSFLGIATIGLHWVS